MEHPRRIAAGLALAAALASAASASAQQPAGVWTAERAQAWGRENGWLVGANYAPATAINQLEVWQAETWDPATIGRERGWAQGLGMNTMRVFLHDLPYRQDPEGFLRRVDEFLAIADRRGIRPMSRRCGSTTSSARTARRTARRRPSSSARSRAR